MRIESWKLKNMITFAVANEKGSYYRDEAPHSWRVSWGWEATVDCGTGVFRTCDAFRVEAVYLCGICQTPPSTEIHKTALGAEESVSWQYFKTALDAVAELKKAGYTVLSVEQVEHSTKLHTFVPQKGQKYAVVMGNEVKGVHQEVVDASDGCLEIPQLGTKHSMNVSVTTGIVIYKFAESLIL